MPTTDPFIKPDWPAPANVFALSSTRRGGYSSPPYDSLNLAHHVADVEPRVAANREVLAAALPVGTRVQWLTQVHGVRAVEAGQGGGYPEADAAWSAQSGMACGVLTADCLPVLFCSAAGDRVAAAHAGWRGLLDGVLQATVTALAVDPGQLLAWLGPAIGPGAFEVGPEVRDAYLGSAPAADRTAMAACFVPAAARHGHFLADLYALARLRLRAAGVTRVFGGDCCTFADSARFFSYRRDGQTGRMASLILLDPA